MRTFKVLASVIFIEYALGDTKDVDCIVFHITSHLTHFHSRTVRDNEAKELALW